MRQAGVTKRVVPWEKRRLREDAAAISIASFPSLDLTRLRPGPIEQAGAAGRLRKGVHPLARREREERTIAPWWAGSGVAHALLLFAALFLMTPKGPPSSPEPPTVEMIYGEGGASGMQGASVPKAQQGANAPPVDAPAPTQQELEAPEPLLEAPPAPPLPAMPTPPSPTPQSAPPRETLEETRSQRAPHAAHHVTQSTNPFANMTDLSLAPSPHMARPGRGGSGSAINLSIGPMVQGGRLAMPFSMRGGHGMTSDYQSMIDDWVEAHKYYPDSAAHRGHDGNVTIHVTWNRDGKVLAVQLESGSGDQDLDDAWTGLFRGAHLPPPPPDVKGDPISYDMTMHYILEHR